MGENGRAGRGPTNARPGVCSEHAATAGARALHRRSRAAARRVPSAEVGTGPEDAPPQREARGWGPVQLECVF